MDIDLFGVVVIILLIVCIVRLRKTKVQLDLLSYQIQRIAKKLDIASEIKLEAVMIDYQVDPAVIKEVKQKLVWRKFGDARSDLKERGRLNDYQIDAIIAVAKHL